MDLYISSLLLGAVGLGAMALSGLGRGHSDAHGHGDGAGHGGHSVAHGHAHLGHSHGGHGHGQHGDSAHGHTSHLSDSLASKAFWSIMSPRFLFSFALGFGAAGELFKSALGGPALFAAAVGGAVLFERLLVSPLWNFTMRFASEPATTLESAITDEATAVTSFDANGQGIVSLEVDGQVHQILATLKASDRLPGTRVRAGQRLRIEDVDAERNRCTVTLL
jgi:hypothetical protein